MAQVWGWSNNPPSLGVDFIPDAVRLAMEEDELPRPLKVSRCRLPSRRKTSAREGTLLVSDRVPPSQGNLTHTSRRAPNAWICPTSPKSKNSFLIAFRRGGFRWETGWLHGSRSLA
jgi:hypothetical protein